MPAAATDADIEQQVRERTAGLRDLLGRQENRFDEEKRQLAHVLHADLGATLTALNMQLAILFRQMPPEEKLQERAAAIKALTGAIAQSTRQMEAGLRADKLDSFGLKATLSDLAAGFVEDTGIGCNVSLPDEELAYPPHIDLALYRMVVEALANISRHAQARQVDIVLDDNEDEIRLVVRDDGAGFPGGEKTGAKSAGLLLLQQRALFLGGEFSIKSQPGKGTSLILSLPPQTPESSAA